MSETMVIEIGQQGLYVALLVAAPLLLTSLVIGLLVSLVQVATSIQDVTLTFVPKIVLSAVVLALIGPWMIRTIVDFTQRLWTAAPGILG